MKGAILNLAGQILFGLSLLLCIPPVMSNKEAAPPSDMPVWVVLILFALSKVCLKLAGNEKGWSMALQAGIFAVFVVVLKSRLSLGL